MPCCAFIKTGGERCGATAMKGYETCYGHREDLAEERKRNASKGGRTGGRGRGGSGELQDLKKKISKVIDGVLDGSQDRGCAAVAIQGFNSLRGVLELERKVRELDELEARLAELEELLERQNGGKRWGA